MPSFFINKEQIDNEYITIYGDDAHHISRSLRMAAGEHITVSDGDSFEYDCVLKQFNDGNVVAKIVNKYTSEKEMPVKVHLFQALPKGEKLDFIIQKSVECGVFDITLFESERCVVKVKENAENRKNERRNKIALEACKQCGRGRIVEVYPTVSFEKMLDIAGKSDAVLFCYEGEGTEPLGEVLNNLKATRELEDIALIIGCEGGFSLAEVESAEKRGFAKIGLGKRILRAETASIMALSCLVYEFELK